MMTNGFENGDTVLSIRGNAELFAVVLKPDFVFALADKLGIDLSGVANGDD